MTRHHDISVWPDSGWSENHEKIRHIPITRSSTSGDMEEPCATCSLDRECARNETDCAAFRTFVRQGNYPLSMIAKGLEPCENEEER